MRGIVQGVGFRPFVFGLAERLGLTGMVRNDPIGVEIDVQGDGDSIAAFVSALASGATTSHVANESARFVLPVGASCSQVPISER
ncbi:hypothetical protein BH20GEM1_BH20GEM1_12300 [soil metagenome]